MEEIKVGEYVRTYNGIIGKVVRITDTGNYAIRIYNGAEYVIKAVILKHSENIIDLIEGGDYLNGYLVRRKNGKLCNFDLNIMEWTPLEHIDIFDTLVTHEQFKQVEYKI